MQTSVKLYSYSYTESRTYLLALLFIVGNIALPQLFHLVPMGGKMWLPIYFFTLIGAYKYGWKVGLLTALLSPLINSLLFGMPTMAVVPAIAVKSALLAAGCGYAAHRYQKVTIALLLGVVLFYQLLGTLFEWAWCGSLYAALQDFRIAVPGMLAQIFGGYLFINFIIRK